MTEHLRETTEDLVDVEEFPELHAIWSDTMGNPSVCVAILDGPIDLKHPSFIGADIRLIDGTSTRVTDGPALQHGTSVASIIFGQHQGKVKGIAPACRGINIPVFIDDGQLIRPCSQLDLARSIHRAIDAGANIINISGGQYSISSQADHFLKQALEECVRKDVLVLAAAGNEGCECLHSPGLIESVLAVGAMNSNGDPLPFSNWGYGDGGILAPGENLAGAALGGGIRICNGTSFATAVVSGIAALLMSMLKNANLNLSRSIVHKALTLTAKNCEYDRIDNCDRLLAGRLNISGSAKYIKNYIMNQLANGFIDGGIGVSEASPGQDRSPTTPNRMIVMNDTDIQERRIKMNDEAAQPDERLAFSEATDPTGVVPASYKGPTRSSDPAEFDQRLPASEATIMAGVNPSACGCSGGEKTADSPQKIYALGKLSFDYGTRSRRMYFSNAMRIALSPQNPSPPNIDDPGVLLKYLTRRLPVEYTILQGKQFPSRAEVDSFYWTLQIDETPIYAIAPMGSFAFEIQDTLVGFLNDQLTDGAERISLPGVVVGQVRLFTGESVPVIRPDIRGMFSWKTSVLAAATKDAAKATDQAAEDLQEFLTRVYDLTRNLGVTSQDRALNYAATDALLLQGVFNDVRTNPRFKGLELDTFTVEKSPICRSDFDCWDVNLFFYDPNNLQRARRGLRFTVDVSDVVPNILGQRKEFTIR